MATKPWENKAYELYGLRTQNTSNGKPRLWRTASTIKRATQQWYKMKWLFTSNVNDLWGTEVQGYSEFLAPSPLTECNIFEEGKVQEVTIRFFNLTSSDDAEIDFRCAFVKFGGFQQEGPFDMSFMTGAVSPFHDLESLQDFLTAIDQGETALEQWALRDPTNYYSLVDGLRKVPASLGSLEFNNHMTYALTSDSGCRLLRFRLVGKGDMDKAKLTPEEQKRAWLIGRPDEEELPSGNYLSDQLDNLARDPLSFTLQVQVREETKENMSETLYHPGVKWEENVCPWKDLAHVYLTSRIPKTLEERSRYDFSKVPDGLDIKHMASADPFQNLIVIREKVLTATVRKRGPEDTESTGQVGETTTYLIHVETGSHMFAGTDAGVYITLYGTKTRTKRILLDKSFHDDFERGSKDAYYVTGAAVGDVKFVKLFLKGGRFLKEWFLHNIVIFDLGNRKMFDIPCYRWIEDQMTLMTGIACLPQYQKDRELQCLRRLEIAQQQSILPWKLQENLPGRAVYGRYKDLPRDLKFTSQREWEKKLILGEVAVKLKLHKYMTMFNSFDSFEDFVALTGTIRKSETCQAVINNDKWKTDEEFGREFLNGMNPVMIQRYTNPLPNFPVTNEMVGNLLLRGKTLEEEMRDGYVYIVDYADLEGIPRRSGNSPRYTGNPLCLFYVRPSGKLVPIAIQIDQVPGENTPIWTPNDAELDWLLAKMWVRSADSHIHSINVHYGHAHAFAEVFGVSLLRHLPSVHPIHKLLISHLMFTIAVNTTGREVLLTGEDSIFYKLLSVGGQEFNLISKYYSRFHIDDLIVPNDLKRRGVDDREKLPNYFFRDDALRYWHVVQEYVERVIVHYYHEDSDVKSDTELQSWMKDLRDNGIKNWNGHDDGVSGSLATTAELIELLTLILFNSTCFHAAVNFAQEDYYSFGPNYPGAMRQPPPTKKGSVTMERIMDTLPNKSDQSVAIAFAHYLSEFSENETFLGEFPNCHFVEPGPREAQAWLKKELVKIGEELRRRNQDLDIPYVYLLPERIPNSVAQ